MSYKMTPEHRAKIGLAVRRGSIKLCLHCQKEFWCSVWEQNRIPPKKYCSRVCFKEYFKAHFAKSGEDNKFWKNGSIAFWKRKVLDRDKNTCQSCNFSEEGIMEVDHIIEKSIGGQNRLDNLITLCPNCHRRKTNKFLKYR